MVFHESPNTIHFKKHLDMKQLQLSVQITNNKLMCCFLSTQKDGGTKTAAIVGGVLGVLLTVALIVIILLVYFFVLKNRKSKLIIIHFVCGNIAVTMVTYLNTCRQKSKGPKITFDSKEHVKTASFDLLFIYQKLWNDFICDQFDTLFLVSYWNCFVFTILFLIGTDDDTAM